MTDEKARILGPVMIPDFKMLRYHEDVGFYDLVATAETISKIKTSFDKDFGLKPTAEHTPKTIDDAEMTGSFLLSEKNIEELPENFKHLPFGTWFLEFTFRTPEALKAVESEGLRGFSLEFPFNIVGPNGETFTVLEKFRLMNKLSDLLPFDIHVFGGSTDGYGRNEHGPAHFELKEKSTRKSLGKINMPSLQTWLELSFDKRVDLMNVINGEDISRKDKKAIVRWLELDSNQNLINCQKQWNESNKHNNRTTPI